jgi:ubiquinone/menaquinone biosynthesis C-methylase UbiE
MVTTNPNALTPLCPYCQGRTLQQLTRAAHYLGKPAHIPLYACKKCGFVFSPDPGDHYDAAYYNSYDDFTPGTDAHTQRLAHFKHRAQFLKQQLGSGRVLDIGCARGDFLDAVAAEGFTAIGLEVSVDAARDARQRGYEVLNANAQALPFADKSFTAIHMNHVLEHVIDPIAALREICRVLRPNGLAIIEVPNELGPLAIRLKLLVGRLGVPNTPTMRYAPHVNYFKRQTLAKAAHKAQLRIVSLTTRPYFPIRPQLSTIPAMLARRYDLLTGNSDLLEIVVTPA